MKKIGLVVTVCLGSIFSCNAFAERYAENPVVNQECIKNLLLIQASSLDIFKESKLTLNLIDSHKWVGGVDRSNLISTLEKSKNDYKMNYDYLSNNSKTKIVNELFKQDCIIKSSEKVSESSDIAAESKKYRIALELTIANTSNIMAKNNCNVEESCVEELNQALFDRLHPEIKALVEKEKLSETVTQEKTTVIKSVSSTKQNQFRSKPLVKKDKNILLEQIDVKVCE